MIYAYGVTIQGTYHVKNNIVCQDAHEFIKCPNDICIAAVADGLGSEEHSDIASKISVKIATKYCADNVNENSNEEEIITAIRTSFLLAHKTIEDEAKKNNHELNQYGTTLSLAVLIHDTLYYGHAGDSGIIALTTEGLYVEVTKQQRDNDGFVFPLNNNQDKWIFSKFEKKVASVFLATDGLYDTLFPIVIRNEKVNIYVLLARFFMDNNYLHIDDIGENSIKEKVEKFIRNIPDSQVNDDKTVLVLINTSIQTELQQPDYYIEPNWAELKQKWDATWKKEAYPHLFKDEPNNDQPPTENCETKNPSTTQEIVGEETDNSIPDIVPIIEEEAPIFEIDYKDTRLLNKIIDYLKKIRNQNN